MLFFGAFLCLIALSHAACNCGTGEVCTTSSIELDLSVVQMGTLGPYNVDACIDTALAALLGSDTECQSSGDVSIQLPVWVSDCGMFFNVPISASLDVDSSGNGCANAQVNSNMSEVLAELVACTLTEEITAALPQFNCTQLDKNVCSFPATVANYESCACQGAYAALGDAGYNYITDISNWIQKNLASVAILGLGNCEGDLIDIDCYDEIPDCDVNTFPGYENCTETGMVEAGGSLDVLLDMCFTGLPSDRRKLFGVIKRGFELSAGNVTLDVWVPRYRSQANGTTTNPGGKGKGKGKKASKGKAKRDFMGTLVDCDADEFGYAVKLEATWPTEEALFAVAYKWIIDEEYPKKVQRLINNGLEGLEDLLSNNTLILTDLGLNMTLKTSDGSVIRADVVIDFFAPEPTGPTGTLSSGNPGNSGAMELSVVCAMMLVALQLAFAWN